MCLFNVYVNFNTDTSENQTETTCWWLFKEIAIGILEFLFWVITTISTIAFIMIIALVVNVSILRNNIYLESLNATSVNNFSMISVNNSSMISVNNSSMISINNKHFYINDSDYDNYRFYNDSYLKNMHYYIQYEQYKFNAKKTNQKKYYNQ